MPPGEIVRQKPRNSLGGFTRHADELCPLAPQVDGGQVAYLKAGILELEQVGVDGELPADVVRVERRSGLEVVEVQRSVYKVDLRGVVLAVRYGVLGLQRFDAFPGEQAGKGCGLGVCAGCAEGGQVGALLVDGTALGRCRVEGGLRDAVVLVREELPGEQRGDAG